MRLHPLSDLHLEITEWRPAEGDPPAADLVLLAGDTHTKHRGPKWAAARWPDTPVCMIAGNHEYYGGSWVYERTHLRRHAKRHGVHFLEQDTCDFPDLGIRVAGATLWTDFDLLGVDSRLWAMSSASQYMNDYRRVARSSPELARQTHLRTVRWLEKEGERAAQDGIPLVVMTHHPPIPDSLGPRQHEAPLALAAAYASARRDLVERVGAVLWLCGHTHYSLDRMVGTTRVLSNPRGYPAYLEGNPGFRPDLIVNPFESPAVEIFPWNRLVSEEVA